MLANEVTLRHWTKILDTLSKTTSDKLILGKIERGLEVHRLHLVELAGLFDYPPYPGLQQLAHVLEQDSPVVKAFLQRYDRDPRGGRTAQTNGRGKITKTTEQILSEQWDTAQIAQVIKHIQHAITDNTLTSHEHYDLAQQITYINAVGKDHPLAIKGLDGASDSTKIYNNLTIQSRAELRRIADFLIKTIRKPGLSKSDKLKAQLNLLAVLREHYFRATGRFAHTTELITVLMTLKNQSSNTLIGLGRREDKALINALVAVMQWVDADGGAVDLCTANPDIAAQEYHQQGNSDFFTSLGIESSCLAANSPAKTYKTGGINYSTIGDLALYRARAKLEKEPLTAAKEGVAVPSHLILTQPDFTALNSRAFFSLGLHAACAKDVFDDYKAQGRIIGLAEVLGTTDELVEQAEQFHLETVFRISAHSDEQFKGLKPEAIRVIQGVISEAIPTGQPVVLIARNAQEVSYLEESLSRLLKVDFHQVGIFTGKESLDVRKKWSKEQAGKPYTLTLITSAVAHEIGFDTTHSDGFLAVQSYLDTPRNTSRLIKHMTWNARPGHYVAIYDEHGMAYAKSWFHESEEERQSLVQGVATLHKKRREAVAIERYYLQGVAEMQEVLMQQFNEWQAFLHSITPKHELVQLNHELWVQKENLVRSIDEVWLECLEQSNLEQKHRNPYHLSVDELDKAKHQFEVRVEGIWTQQCGLLKAKTAGKVQEDSREALHCDYLMDVSVIEQLGLSQLRRRKCKEGRAKEQKKAHRYLTAGLDVNGALLSYSDADVASYRLAYRESQVNFFKNDIATLIENNTYISKSIRTYLGTYVQSARSLHDLVLILNSYANRWLREEHFEKKYEMQTLVQQIVFAYQQAGLKETSELKILKATYFDNVLAEITTNLELTLSWAVEGNRGLGYWLERTAVTHAATEILSAIAKLRAAAEPGARQLAVKDLYQILVQHQAQLEGLWIFSLGHKNTLTLINETLATLDGLTSIGSGKNALGADFILSCKEAAVKHVMQKRFAATVHVIERDSTIKDHELWKVIRASFDAIQKDNESLHAFYEMNYVLVKHIEAQQKNNSKLVAPLIKLRGALRNIWHECSQEHKKLMDESTYFACKAANLKEEFTALDGFAVERVALKPVHNGFSSHLDLVIEGKGVHPALADFTQYHSKVADLVQMRQAMSEQFSEVCRERVSEIQRLQAYAKGEMPDDLNAFPEAVRNNFQDHELLRHFVYDALDLVAIARLKNEELKIQFFELYAKLHAEPSPSGIWSRLWGAAPAQETEEVLSRQYVMMKNTALNQLEAYFHPDINTKQTQLAQERERWEAKIAFLDKKIAEEKANGGVYHKRFKDMGEFYEFEAQLKVYKPKVEVPAPAKNDVADVAPLALAPLR